MTATAGNSKSSAQGLDKAPFLLVHPAWLGGWCWRKVTPLLRAAGHDVYTPTLTGLGERDHLSNPQIGLATHIEDVVSVLEFEDLRRVALVGTSSGGMVITGIADAYRSGSRTSSTSTPLCPRTVKASSTCCRPTDGKRWRTS